MSAATSGTVFDDFCTTDWAWLTFVAEDSCEFFQIISLSAVSFAIGCHGRSAGFDGGGHDSADGSEQAVEIRLFEC